MSEKNLDFTRRKFMAVSSAAIAAPFVMKMTGAVPNVEAAEKENGKPYKGLKSVVIYYSQSGNTKKIGQAIQKGIISQTGQCDLVRVKEITPEELKKYDLIGIGAPTWSSCPSPLVIYFCKSLPATLKDKHFFWFSLHGCSPGRCLIRGVQPLLDAGMTVIGWKDWYGDAWIHSKPWYTDGYPDTISLMEAEAWGKAMAMHSWKISAEGRTDIIPKLHSKESSDEIWGLGVPQLSMGGGPEDGGGREGGMPAQTTPKKPSTPPPIPTSAEYVCKIEGLPSGAHQGSGKGQYGAQDLKIDASKCIKCKLCVRGCPCNNIDDSTFPYTFISQDCEFELFCEALCPTGAITIIDTQLEKTKMPAGGMPEGMPKGGGYNSLLYTAEATGRFRWIIKEEDVGSKGSFYDVAPQHPRFKELF